MFCFIFFKKLKTKALRVFFVYSITIAILLILSISSTIFFKNGYVYMILLRVYIIVEYYILSRFLILLINNLVFKRIIQYSLIPFFVFTLITYYYSSVLTFNRFSLVVEFILLLGFIILYFYEKIKTVTNYPLSQLISFWICVGFFIYFAGNFFFLLLLNFSSNKEVAFQLQIVYSIVTITKNIILCLALFANEPTENIEELRIPDELNLDEFTPTNPKTLQ